MDKNTDKDSNDEKLSPGKAFYKHLMNGVSNMLPLVAGGILMAIVFYLVPTHLIQKALNIMRLQNNCGILVIRVPLH